MSATYKASRNADVPWIKNPLPFAPDSVLRIILAHEEQLDAEQRRSQWQAANVESVPLSRLFTVQPEINPVHIDYCLTNFYAHCSTIKVYVIRKLRLMVVADGNHRTVAAKQRGDTHIAASIVAL